MSSDSSLPDSFGITSIFSLRRLRLCRASSSCVASASGPFGASHAVSSVSVPSSVERMDNQAFFGFSSGFTVVSSSMGNGDYGVCPPTFLAIGSMSADAPGTRAIKVYSLATWCRIVSSTVSPRWVNAGPLCKSFVPGFLIAGELPSMPATPRASGLPFNFGKVSAAKF